MKYTYFVIWLFLILFFTSCQPKYYLPTKQNVMVFKEKGDAILSISMTTNNGTGIEAGYAFTDNIGVYTSLNNFDITYGGNSNGFGNDYSWDNEIMYFNKDNSGLYTGVNVGVGFGKLNQNNPYYKLDLTRQFIQPTLGVTMLEYVDLAFSMRVSHLNYSLKPLMKLDSDYDVTMFNQYFNLNDLAYKNYFFIEPAITLGFNFKFCKLQFQYAGAIDTKREDFSYIQQNLITSLSFNINKLFFNKKSKTEKLRWTF